MGLEWARGRRRGIFTSYFVSICVKYTHMHMGHYEKNVFRYSATIKKERNKAGRGEGKKERKEKEKSWKSQI